MFSPLFVCKDSYDDKDNCNKKIHKRWELYFAKAKLQAVSLLLKKNLWANVICEYTSELSNSVTGLQKCCMKPRQSLFLLVMAPSKVATSPLANSHIALAHRFSSKRETAGSLYKRLQRPLLKSYSHHCYSLCTEPPLPSDFYWGNGVCTQATLNYLSLN